MTSPLLADKPPQYNMMKPVLGKGLITINNPEHRSHRKVISTSMHLDILKGFVRVFSDRGQELVCKLRSLSEASGGGVVNMTPALGFCVNHSLCETVLSTDMAGVEADRDELIRVADKASWLMFYRFFRPWYWSEQVFALLSRRYAEYQTVVHGMQNFVHKVGSGLKPWEAHARGRWAHRLYCPTLHVTVAAQGSGDPRVETAGRGSAVRLGPWLGPDLPHAAAAPRSQAGGGEGCTDMDGGVVLPGKANDDTVNGPACKLYCLPARRRRSTAQPWPGYRAGLGWARTSAVYELKIFALRLKHRDRINGRPLTRPLTP